MKPYSESCDQNQQPILEVVAPLLKDKKHVLEIGSGTGQHAVFFAEKMPNLIWQTSDREENHSGIKQWLAEAHLDNIRMPLVLDSSQEAWPELVVDAVFSANTTHIMHWPDVVNLFAGVGTILQPGGIFLLYGPFSYNNQYSSESNARFDLWLKERDPQSGVRNFQDLDALAKQAGMDFVHDYKMPANNQILYWQKT